jgi:hypothetical protein
MNTNNLKKLNLDCLMALLFAEQAGRDVCTPFDWVKVDRGELPEGWVEEIINEQN